MTGRVQTSVPKEAKGLALKSQEIQKGQKMGERTVVNIGQEVGFSSKKYLALALIIGSVALNVLSKSLLLSCALFGSSLWYLFSAVVTVLNQMSFESKIKPIIRRLHAFVAEANCAVSAAMLFPLTFFPSYHRPKGDLTGQPILMINGYLSFGSTWHYQRRKLSEAGLGPIYTINIGSGQPIKTYAKEVQKKVQEIQKETKQQKITLIGHSKGGLLSAAFATEFSEEMKAQVTDVIMIGSPVKGTPLARLGPGDDARDMEPNAHFHQELRQKIKEHPEVRFSYIASELDEIVPPDSTIWEEGSSRRLVLNDLGHLGLLFSSRVTDQICAWLKVGP